MPQSAGDILAGVKQSVQESDAKERLTRPSPTPVPEGLKSPEHEYSRAPYTMVHKPAKPDVSDEAYSAGEGIKARQEMEKKALQ
jgi:hypothetical protein